MEYTQNMFDVKSMTFSMRLLTFHVLCHAVVPAGAAEDPEQERAAGLPVHHNLLLLGSLPLLYSGPDAGHPDANF